MPEPQKAAKRKSRKSLADNPLTSLSVLVSPITRFRYATIDDIPSIKEILESETYNFFGYDTFESIIETAIHAYVLEDNDEFIVGFIAFQNYPNITAVPRTCWLEPLAEIYHIPGLTYENCVFVNYFVVDVRFDPHMYKTVYAEMFMREPKLKFICVIAPPVDDGIYDQIFGLASTRILPKAAIHREELEWQSMYICNRYNILKKMRFRKALPEDNDDIVEIIDQKKPEVREELGDYYIAEEVLKEESDQNIIVTEIGNFTVGMMWLNTSVDLEKLNENFDLKSFGNLAKESSKGHSTQVVCDIVKLESETFFEHIVSVSDTSDQRSEDSNAVEPKSQDSSFHAHFIQSYFSMLGPSVTSTVKSEASQQSLNNLAIAKWDAINRRLDDTSRYYRTMHKTFAISAEPNAFAIQLFGLHSRVDERRIYDLLAASFALYPEKDYCVLTVQTKSVLHTSLLKYFTRVIPRPDSHITESLYIAHKSAVLGELRISHLGYDDLTEIEKILCFHCGNESRYPSVRIMEIIFDVLENPNSTMQFLIVRSNGIGIGFIVVGQGHRIDLLHRNYDLEMYDCERTKPDYMFGEIIYLILLPLFEWLSAYIFREISRLTGYQYLYYLHKKDTNEINYVNMLLTEMYPVSPKKLIQIHTPNDYARISIPGSAFDTIQPCSLYYQSLKLSQNPRINVDTRIVVIGFDETCKGFLKTLIFSEYSKNMKFANITVIVNPGIIEAEYSDFLKDCEDLFELKHCNLNYMKRIELRTWVNFIGSHFSEINRTVKCVILNENNNHIHYDVLFLFCSSDFGIPQQVPDSQIIPVNYAQMNTILDGIILYHKIQLLKMENQNDIVIVIYGNSLAIHGCVHFLLNNGIRPDCVHLVLSVAVAGDDEFVEDFVARTEVDLGVRIYKNFNFVRWNLNDKGTLIRSLVFQSKMESFTLGCALFLCYDDRPCMERRVKQALERSALVMIDDRIVINENCQTSDTAISAAGRCTRYDASLLGANWEHEYYNLTEIGGWLAEKYICDKRANHIQRFTQPICQQIRLPKNMLYANFREPGPKLPRNVADLLHNYGTDMVTGWHHSDPNTEELSYCYVNLSEKGFVRNVVCLTNQYKNLDIFGKIYGQHESLLNNLKTRYTSGRIASLLDFFHQTWIDVILHSNFDNLQTMNRECMREALQEYINSEGNINWDYDRLKEFLLKANCDKKIEDNLLRFIRRHPDELFMYAMGERREL